MTAREQSPVVSVLMPVWNRARFVGEAVASVLAQTYARLELIVIDDGSTDDTPTVLRRVTDPRVRVVRQEHRGIAPALNRALAEARGAYVARLDSDDRWLPEALATLLPVLESRPELAFVYARGQAMNEAGRRLPHLVGLPPRFPDDPLASLLYDDCTCNIALLVRRAALGRAGPYDESLVVSEDWDMWLRVARDAPFAFVDRVVALFRWHADNTTGLRSPQRAQVLESRVAVLDRFFAGTDVPPRARAIAPLAYRNVYTFMTIRCLHAGDLAGAARCFRRSLSTGTNPIVALPRNLAFVLAYGYLARRRWGRRLTGAAARAGHAWRAHRAARR